MGVLDGKVAVITGSSHGLGLAIVTSLDITFIASYKIV
jgi:short-subunit dehydrogenase